jgi:hypothetical protein
MLKSIALTAALVAGVSGVARADDSSMNPFTGDSYADFNRPTSKASTDPAWRQNHPNGFTHLEEERLLSHSMAYQPAPVFDTAPSAWRQSHPNGLSEGELQALSSEALGWHPSANPATSALASTNDATDMKSASR